MDYTALVISTAEKIRKNGRAVVFRKAGTVPADYSVFAVDISSERVGFVDRLRDGSSIKEGDRRFMLAAVDANGATIPVPAPNDTLFLGTTAGRKLAIVSVLPLSPGEIPVFYEVQCRGG